MQQRADDYSPLEQPRPSTPETTDKPGLSTADLAAAGNRPAAAAGPDRPPNVTPIGAHGDRGATITAGSTIEADHTPLFSSDEAERLRSDWHAIQAGFVDEPRHAVEKADELVARTIKRLAEVFADERGKLEEQWSRGDNVSTEDLRLGLQRYRSFFDRLLSV